jgi:CSLREA domain-containing protein
MSRNPLGFRLIAFVVLGLALASARAATITVNSAADTAANDGVCTLREAIIAANTNTASGAMAGECIAGDILPTVDVIEFAIAGAGVHTITPLTTLPIISQAVTINGYSQTGSSANTNAMSAGINAVLLIEIDTENFTQLRVTGANTTIRGLVINRGVDKIVVAADGVTIAGNFLGTNAAGTAALSSVSGGFGVRHESGNNMTVGGAAAADRNLISGNVQGGVTTDLGFSNTFTGHLIQGNYIGPDVTGTLSLSSGASTAAITSLNNATVRGNLISGNGGGGIVMAHASGTGPVIVQGNLIGTQRDGTSALGNGQSGLSILSSSNAIGGTAAGEGNTIAFNTVSGVALANNIDSNRILGNSIHSNGGLGISLNGNSPGTPLPNDAGDADTLPGNNGQNYPVVTSASFSAGNVVVSGTLNSTASTTFRLEFFVNPACDTSLHGEGKTFIGFGTVTTDAGGNASFNGLSFASATGGAITATATVNPSAGVFTDTSEFSVCTATLLPPVITKNFLSPTIQAGALSQVGLSITIQNPNPQVPGDFTANHLTGVGFTDTLPGALILFTPSGLTGSCSGVTAVEGSNQVTMSNGTVGAGLTCTILVTVNAPAGTPSGLLHNVTEQCDVDRGRLGQRRGFRHHGPGCRRCRAPLQQAVRRAGPWRSALRRA